MEKLSTSVKNSKLQLSKPHSAQWSDVVVKALVKCSLHFQASLTEPDYEIYLQGLADIEDPTRIRVALDTCLNECSFMPRLKDIRDRLPVKVELGDEPTVGTPHCRIIGDWIEPFSRTAQLHYFKFEDGSQKVRVEKLEPCETPKEKPGR